MEKKSLKCYEAPEVEVVEMELQGFVCWSQGGQTKPGDDNDEIEM